MTRFLRHPRQRLLVMLLTAVTLVLGGPAASSSGADATPGPDASASPAPVTSSAP